ncbi:MAG: CDP-alcohol phosphatidyltransferase family protein [Planctomycetota bacterium]
MIDAIPRWLRLCVPTSLTLMNMGLGVAGCVIAVAWASDGVPGSTVALLVPMGLMTAAMMADGLDGATARRLGVTTAMGRRLDQVADGVTSALMPASVMASLAVSRGDAVGSGVAVAFVACGWARLVRQADRVGPGGGQFVGLPLPVAGWVTLTLACGLAVLGARGHAVVAVAASTVVGALCVMMLSGVRCYPSPAGCLGRLRRRPLLPLTSIAVPMVASPWLGLGEACLLACLSVSAVYVLDPLDRSLRRRLAAAITPARSPSSASRSAR